MARVYLAGGTVPGAFGAWQDRVRETVDAGRSERGRSRLEWLDPSKIQDKTMQDIAAQERAWLDSCDVLFVYWEATSHYLVGTAAEIGYTAGRQTAGLLVAWDGVGGQSRRILEWLLQLVGSRPATDLDRAIEALIRW